MTSFKLQVTRSTGELSRRDSKNELARWTLEQDFVKHGEDGDMVI